MQTLSEKEIICRIRNRETFSAVINTAAFTITIDRYVPAVCTAVHDDHNISGELAGKLLRKNPNYQRLLSDLDNR